MELVTQRSPGWKLKKHFSRLENSKLHWTNYDEVIVDHDFLALTLKSIYFDEQQRTRL